MKKLIVVILFSLISMATLAQGLYSKSLSITDITGVWSNGYTSVESRNAIASNANPDYVSSHLCDYKNISIITTEKLEYKDKTYYIWEIDYIMKSSIDKDGVPSTHFLALTEAQNSLLKTVSTDDVSIVKIPTYTTMTMFRTYKPETIVEGIKKAILEKDDYMAYTYTITAKKSGDHVYFNYDVDCWTHDGDVNNRKYEILDLFDNIDGGYFKFPIREWMYLFFR